VAQVLIKLSQGRQLRALVTGGAGFIGSHFCEALIAEGHEVLAVDNLCTGSMINLDPLSNAPRFSFEIFDIIDPFEFGRVDFIFNLASPGPRLRARDGRVVSNFMMQALRGDDLTIYGNGKQTRSFCYVSDLVEGMLRLGRSSENSPVNVGNPNEFTIEECAKEVLGLTGSKSMVRYLPLPQDDPKQRCPDITRARNLLGWEPTIDLRTGLQKSLPYFKSLLGQCSGGLRGI